VPKRFDTTIEAVFEALRFVPGDVPLVAFGQSPFWDEPMKAIVAAAADRPMIAGIHDLDYFSRLRGTLPGPEWQIIPHNDGSLRDAWVAAGEFSVPFGSEHGVTRQGLSEAGVRLQSLMPADQGRHRAALDAATSSWGWRGLVHNVTEPAVMCDVPACAIAPALGKLLNWGFRQTARLVANDAARAAVRLHRHEVMEWIETFLAVRPGATCSDLYLDLLRRFYERLIGPLPEQLSFTTTRTFFRFDATSAGRPRFAVLGLFLDPRTAAAVRRAYDEAVSDTGMTTLQSMGPDATPFDVYAPGRGRGTLRIGTDEIAVDFPQRHVVRRTSGERSISALARELNAALGPDISVVGKAVILPVMLASEAIMVLHETASAYVPLTQRMLATLADEGVRPALNPILRIRLSTWDSIGACALVLRLPAHLARTFASQTICSTEFAHRWSGVVRAQRALLRRLARTLSPCELVEYLGQAEHETWLKRLEACQRANAILIQVQRALEALRRQAADLRQQEDVLAEEIASIERRRGELNRESIRPLKERLASLPPGASAAERTRIEAELERALKEGQALLLALAEKRDERKRCAAARRAIGRKIRVAERGRKARAARETLRRVFHQSERARLALARDAHLTINGLCAGDARPSAWWMLALDPSRAWFERIRRTARGRLERLPERPRQ